jgi:hypothetical protein
MNKGNTKKLLLSLFVAGIAFESSYGASGLRLSVVDKNSKGVQSEIYAESNNIELKIGITDLSGQFFDTGYRCNSDRNLIAKPVDRTYFDSPPQPCKSPEKLLVISRLTPNGHLAFGGFSRPFKSSRGDIGQATYAVTIETAELDDVAKAVGGKNLSVEDKNEWLDAKCALDYKVYANKSKFVLKEDNWQQVEESSEPASKLVLLTSGDIAKRLDRDPAEESWATAILKTDTGFIVGTRKSCTEARAAADKFRDTVEKAYVSKFKRGEYDEKNDQFLIKGGED